MPRASSFQALISGGCVLVFALALLGFGVGPWAIIPRGVSPDSTVVVINGASPASALVARAWMERRGLEAERAVVLSDVPLVHRITLADFQRLILLPLEVELIRQGRAATTRLVVYGPDFPTAITFDDRGLGPEFRSPGSLTGMTFLAPLLSAGGRVFTALDANSYADQPALPGAIADLRAFADTRNQRAMELILAKDFRSSPPSSS